MPLVFIAASGLAEVLDDEQGYHFASSETVGAN